MNDHATLARHAAPKAPPSRGGDAIVDLSRARVARALEAGPSLERNLSVAADAVELLVDLLRCMAQMATADAAPGPDACRKAQALAARQEVLSATVAGIASRAPVPPIDHSAATPAS